MKLLMIVMVLVGLVMLSGCGSSTSPAAAGGTTPLQLTKPVVD